MNRISAISLLLISTLVLAAVACGSDSEPTPTAVPAAPAPSAPAAAGAFAVNLQDPGGSGSYVFSPSALSFSVGQTVDFALTSENEFHTFTVESLGIDQDVDAGSTVNLTFTFDTAGTYEIICVPHEALGMVGTITVQ